MWEFRRRPAELSAEEKGRLDELLRRLPRLKTLYDLRVRFQEIFDTACPPAAGGRRSKS
jgi:hypothetical protein